MAGPAASTPPQAQTLPLAMDTLPTPTGPRLIWHTEGEGLVRGGPLILGMHGGGGGGRRFAERSGLIEAFAALGNDIVFPQANSHWSDGRTALEPGWEADRAMFATLAEMAGPRPIAAVGVSNGGMFAQRLACEADPRIAVVVAVAAALPADYARRAPVGPPVPVMLVQATEDRLVRWGGGEVPHVPGLSVAGELLGADDTAGFWLDRNRCTGAPRLRQGRIGPYRVEIYAWIGQGDADVWRVVLRGAGHRLLDRDPEARLAGSLEELVARFVVWHVDRTRLAGAAV